MSRNVEQKVVDSTLAEEPSDQAMELGMCKREDVTYVTFCGDPKAVMPGFGTTDADFFFGLLHQVANAGSNGLRPDERGIKFMLAFIKGSQPRDQTEAMLQSQMAATHVAAMRFANRLAHAESHQEQDSAERAFNRLMRTFAAQVEALQRYRSASGDKTIVQNVSVSDGGQAIVGNVTRSAHETTLKKRMRRTPVRACVQQSPREILGDTQRVPVPLRRRKKEDGQSST